MDSTNRNEILEYLIGLIQHEKYHIERESKYVSELADLVINELQHIKNLAQDTRAGHIAYPNMNKILYTLQQISNTYQSINCRKQNIRYFRDEIVRFKGWYREEWK
jgi:hypothetical protein